MLIAEHRRFRLRSRGEGNRRARRAALAAAAGNLFCGTAWCQTLLWNNSFGGNVHQATHWTLNMVPTTANNAVFNLNATYTVTNPSLLPIEAALLQVRSGTVIFDEVLWQTDAVEIGPLAGDDAYVQFNGFQGPSFMGVGIAERTGFTPPTVLVGGAGIGSMYYDSFTLGTFSASSLTIGAAASGKGIVQLNNFSSSVSGDVIVGDAGDGYLYTDNTTVGGHLHIGKSAGGVGTAHFAGTANSVSIAPAVGATGTLYGGVIGAAAGGSFDFAYVGGSVSGPGGAGTLAASHPSFGNGWVNAQTLRLYNTGTVVLNEGGILSYDTLVHDPNPNVVFGTGWTLQVTSFAADALKIGSGQFIPASFNMPALSQIAVTGGVQLLSGGSFNLGTGGLGSGTLSLESNARFNVSGGSLSASALSIQPGSTLSLSSGGVSTNTLSLNGGQINITGGSLSANRILTTSPVPGVFTGGSLTLSASIADALRIGAGEVFGSTLNIVAGQGLNNGGETRVLAGSTLNVAGGTFRTGTLTIDTGGTVTWSSGTFGTSFVVDDHGLFGNTLALTSTRKLNNAGTVIIGQTGAGTITLDTSSQSNSQRYILGEQPGSAGTITTASGASASYTFSGSTVVGGQGTGYLSLPASSSQSLGVLYVGDGAGSHGTVILNGVTASISVNSIIGGGTFYAGSGQGTLSITNSTINFTGQLQIYDGGRVYFNGGTLSGPAITRIDDNGDSVFGGLLQFNSGSILLSAGDLVVGASGFLGPDVTLSDGQNFRTAAAVRIDPGNTLTLDGGFLRTRDLLLNAPPTGRLAFNRGTLAFSNGLLLDSVAPSSPVIGSTLTLNDPGQRLIGTGGTLSVGGAGLGTLSISNGAAGTFSGRIMIGGVTGGTGFVSVGGGTGDSLLTTSSTGTLIVGTPGTGTLNVLSGGTVSTAGTLHVGATGRVNLTGGRLSVGTLISPTGGINWNAGTLAIGAGTVLIGSGTPLGNNLVIDSDMALEINATQNPNLRIGGTAGSAGAITVQSGGRLGSGSMVIGGTNPGTLTIDAGGTFVGS